MGDFKKFIQTNGKSFEEIKKSINDLVNRAVDNVIDTVVDDVTQLAPRDVRRSVKQSVRDARKNAAEGTYKPEKIPERFAKKDDPVLVRRDDAPPYSQIYYPHEAHSDRLSPQDEYMLEKIGKMRELEICVRGQGIVKRAVELTMAEQGAFMADVEDDFTRKAFCALPQPVYAAMSNSQLRTFFTWRTDVRRGKFHETDKPYVLLYCYELLNKIGAESSVDAFDKLLETWKGCRPFAPYLNKLMPRWLKDFYAFNDVTEKYPDIASALGENEDDDLSEIVCDFDNENYAGKFAFLAENSAYDINSSIFRDEKTQPLIEACCEASLHALHDYFDPFGIELSDLVCGKLKKDYTWMPFRDAIVNLDTVDGFRPVRISAGERYCVKRGEPALELFCFSPSRGFIGYLLKSVEAELRVRTGFSRKIVPKLQMLQNDFINRTKIMEATSRPEFLKVIPGAVDGYCSKNGIRAPEKRQRSRCDDEHVTYIAPKVEIDISKLAEIRENSEELSRKLIIDDYSELHEPIEIPDTSEESAARIGDDEFSAMIDDCKEELSPHEDEELPLKTGDPAFELLDQDWRTFANNLIPIQIQILKALSEGSVRVFCKERGLLPETVFEEINTEALAAFGDVVIECGELVPDYTEDIARIVKAAGI